MTCFRRYAQSAGSGTKCKYPICGRESRREGFQQIGLAGWPWCRLAPPYLYQPSALFDETFVEALRADRMSSPEPLSLDRISQLGTGGGPQRLRGPGW